MRLGVLGIGNLGATLGTKWAIAGHEVAFGVRDVNSAKAEALHKVGINNISLQAIDETIAFGEAIVFAVPGAAVESIVETNAEALNHKVIVDATNKIGAAEMSGLATFTVHTPEAKVFRAFNTLGWENFVEPQFGPVQADLFYCGPDDTDTRASIERLIDDVGLRPIYVGGLDQIQLVDSLTRLWLTLALGQKRGRRLAFKMLTP